MGPNTDPRGTPCDELRTRSRRTSPEDEGEGGGGGEGRGLPTFWGGDARRTS